MFCVKCGNEIDENDKFCKECGNSVIKEEICVENKNLPLAWYKFYRYFRLPLSIILSIGGFFSMFNNGLDNWNELAYIFAIILILFTTLQILTVVYFDHKVGYNLNTVLIFAESILASVNCVIGISTELNSIETIVYMLMLLIIINIVWSLPNIIYFKNRKYLFCKD